MPLNSSQIDSSAMLGAIMDATIGCIIAIDERGIMQAVNPSTSRLFGYAEAELLGQNVSILMSSPDRERHDSYLQRYQSTGEARIIGKGRDVTARRKDGATFPVHLSVSEFSIAETTYYAGILHDISERVETEFQQRTQFSEHAHTSRVVALGEMASGIAHEINQPLAAIVGFADASRKLLESGKADQEVIKDALLKISQQGQRAGEIIRRLREFVRKREPNRSTVRLDDMVTEAVALTAHDAKRHGVDIVFEFDDGNADVLVDRLQLQQVVLNLIRNGIESVIESGREDGWVKVESCIEDSQFVISVHDNGIGIRPSDVSRLFSAFYTTKETGTGLGLSISRSIIEAHGGSLVLEPGARPGATFTIRLPAFE